MRDRAELIMSANGVIPANGAAPNAAGRSISAVRLLTGFRECVLLAVILMLGAFLTIKCPTSFLTQLNLKALMLGLSTPSIIAVGMTILLVSGGFDLSVGSLAALALKSMTGVGGCPTAAFGLAPLTSIPSWSARIVTPSMPTISAPPLALRA